MGQLVVNGYNVGTEVQEVILQVNSNGVVIPVEYLGHLKEINVQQQISEVTCTPTIYNGVRLHRNIYHDWSGRLVFTRFNNNLTNLINGIMKSFQTNGAEIYFTLYATVANTTWANQEDEYLWTQVVLGQHDWGTFQGTAEVDQSISFRCQGMTITGTAASVLEDGATVAALANPAAFLTLP